MISINIYEIIMQILNFGILLYLLNRFLFKPLGGYLNEREETIQGNLEKAEQTNKNAEALLQEQKDLLKQAKIEAKEIRNQGEDTARKERENLLNQTKEDAEKILENASKEIEQGYARAKNDLLKEVGNLSIQLSKEILKRDMQKSDHEKVLSSYLENIKS